MDIIFTLNRSTPRGTEHVTLDMFYETHLRASQSLPFGLGIKPYIQLPRKQDGTKGVVNTKATVLEPVLELTLIINLGKVSELLFLRFLPDDYLIEEARCKWGIDNASDSD